MYKKAYMKPRLVSLDLTKPEASALRAHAAARHAVRQRGEPELKLVFARIVSGLRGNRDP